MKLSTVLTIGVIAAVIGMGTIIATDPSLAEEIQENNQHFERYCEERFGDEAEVWVGGGQGAHSGLHCSNGAGETVHLGAVDGMTWERYKAGKATAADVTASVQPIGPMGMSQDQWSTLIGSTIIVSGAVVAIGFVRRRRGVQE